MLFGADRQVSHRLLARLPTSDFLTGAMNQPPKAKLYIEGRYLKHTRDLPQTLFFCPVCKGHQRRRHGCKRCDGFGKLTKDSVQELVGWVIAKAAGTRKHKFHGAGREDVDVSMLGEGRPFVFELESPKVTGLDLAELEATINKRNEGRMEVRGLHWTQKSRIAFLKQGKFVKDYRAKVAVSELPDMAQAEALVGERYVVAQKTPGRVAHRRADLVRDRWIELLAVELPDPEDLDAEAAEGDELFIYVTMRTQAGTYVKEAISGEDGMTEPSVAARLGIADARCIELDVMGILDEEPSEESPSGATDESGQKKSPTTQQVIVEPPSAFGAGL